MTLAIATAPKRDSRHWSLSTITWDEIVAWTDNPGNAKESGNYLLGDLVPTTVLHKGAKQPCHDVHRRKDAIITRSALTLDIDSPGPDFPDLCQLVLPWQGLLHTTFSSAPDDPRYRLIIPVTVPLAPDEYIVACRAVMEMMGADQFDASTDQPERYMFRPAAQQREWFGRWVLDGPTAAPDDLLTGWQPDLRQLPPPKPHHSKRDPYDLPGPVGAFNRVYESLDDLIDEYDLPYTKVDDDRYQLLGAKSVAGMGPVQGTQGLYYSHHVSDPAHGHTCSAFDLVRMHRFGDLDEDKPASTPLNRLPSYIAMIDLAMTDSRVTAILVGADFDQQMDDDVVAPNAWRTKLGPYLDRKGIPKDVIQVWDLITENDPVFALLRFGELSLGPEFVADTPWRAVTRTTQLVTATDRWEIAHYVEREYHLQVSKMKLDAMIDVRASHAPHNPVREYLEGLVWDGVSRIETCLPGVKATDHTRLVARKSLVAAAARMLDPGCKWDHTLVLFGDEGLGKTHWIDRMSLGYSGALGPITQKDTLLAMQQSWIMVADEGHSLRKSDADQIKEFLTRRADLFRMPYDRDVMLHQRHSVIWSTTNDQVFLRRQQGNRRFLIVHCERKVDFDALTDDYVAQVWAEAVYLYRAGEQLWLDDTDSELAAVERERYVEEDALLGQIQEYLSTPVPADWWDRSPEARVAWRNDRAQGWEPEGTMELDHVCSVQIWVECLGRRPGEHRKLDLLEIFNALKRLPGWVQLPGRTRLAGYGPQATFTRDLM